MPTERSTDRVGMRSILRRMSHMPKPSNASGKAYTPQPSSWLMSLMKVAVITEREDAIRVSRIRMPATARIMPITSSLRSGDRLSQNEGPGGAGFATALDLAGLFEAAGLLLPLRLLLDFANGLMSGMGRGGG